MSILKNHRIVCGIVALIYPRPVPQITVTESVFAVYFHHQDFVVFSKSKFQLPPGENRKALCSLRLMSQEGKGSLEHFQSVAVISSASLPPVELLSITKGNRMNYRTLCSALFHSKEMERRGMLQLASLGLFQNCSRLLLLLLTFLFPEPSVMQLRCVTGYIYLASTGKAHACAKLTKARFVFMSKAQAFRLGKGSPVTEQCLSQATLLKERNPGFMLSVKSKAKRGWFCYYRNSCFSQHWESWPVPGLPFLL